MGSKGWRTLIAPLVNSQVNTAMTTLIALVMSLIVMFPTSSLQKMEEDLLNWVDEYCNENLLKRLDDGRLDLVIGGITVSPERALKVAFTRSYVEDTPGFLRLASAFDCIAGAKWVRQAANKESL